MRRAASKKDRLDFRLAPEVKALIERAASVLGQTITEFAVPRLVREAQDILRQQEITTLSNRDREIFLSMLEADVQPNATLKRAAAAYRRQRA